MDLYGTFKRPNNGILIHSPTLTIDQTQGRAAPLARLPTKAGLVCFLYYDRTSGTQGPVLFASVPSLGVLAAFTLCVCNRRRLIKL